MPKGLKDFELIVDVLVAVLFKDALFIEYFENEVFKEFFVFHEDDTSLSSLAYRGDLIVMLKIHMIVDTQISFKKWEFVLLFSL